MSVPKHAKLKLLSAGLCCKGVATQLHNWISGYQKVNVQSSRGPTIHTDDGILREKPAEKMIF